MIKETIDFTRFKYCECGYCNEIILIKDKQGRPRRFKSGHNGKGTNNYYYNKKGTDHPLFKGGRIKHCRGYIEILKPDHPFRNANDRVYEHRLVMEQHLGRYLTREEEVHHINKIKDDNRIENLMLFANSSEHSRYEMMGNQIARKKK